MMKRTIALIATGLMLLPPYALAQQYPGALVTATQLPDPGDTLQVSTTLSASVASTATPPFTVTVSSTTGWPAAGYIIIGASGDYEVMRYDSKTATTFNVVERAIGGNPATTHDSGDDVFLGPANVFLQRAFNEIIAIEAELGVDPSGASATVAARFGTLDNDTFSGAVKFADGTAAAPSIARSADPNLGMYFGPNSVSFSNAAGIERVRFDFAGAQLAVFDDFASVALGVAADAVIARDAANILAMRNGGTAASPVPQALRIYNYDDGANDEYIQIRFVSNTASLETIAAGTGTARDLLIAPSGTTSWAFRTSGNFEPFADNTHDLGTSTLRIANGFFATKVRSDGYLEIADGITAPGTLTGYARIYVDAADGDLKVVFGDGVVKTIVTDI